MNTRNYSEVVRLWGAIGIAVGSIPLRLTICKSHFATAGYNPDL
jgi:hypothetical protein